MLRQVRVADLYDSLRERLGLRLVTGEAGLTNVLYDATDMPRDHIIAGPLNYIHPTPIQVIGPTEKKYLSGLPADEYPHALDRLFSAAPAAIVLTGKVAPSAELIEKAEQSNTPIITSTVRDNIVLDNLQYYASKFLTKKATLHGVFLEVLGSGVLIVGHSAVGKSELALELITRGHRLIADDAPEFTRIAPDIVSGSCPPLLRELLEVRGLGILDIRAMFGDSAIKRTENLQLIIHMKRMKQSEIAIMDRLQESNRQRDVLGVEIPIVTVPVAPGRNLAILVETAVRNHKLKRKGYNAQQMFIERQKKAIDGEVP